MVTHAYNPSIWKTDTKIQIQSQPGLRDKNEHKTPLCQRQSSHWGIQLPRAVAKRNPIDSNKKRNSGCTILGVAELWAGRKLLEAADHSTLGGAVRHQSHKMKCI